MSTELKSFRNEIFTLLPYKIKRAVHFLPSRKAFIGKQLNSRFGVATQDSPAQMAEQIEAAYKKAYPSKFRMIIEKEFFISQDHLENLNMEPQEIKELKRLGYTVHFKLYDDDEELYYSGYMKDNDDVEGFEPLDDFATPDSGCTEIRIRNKDTGKYETL